MNEIPEPARLWSSTLLLPLYLRVLCIVFVSTTPFKLQCFSANRAMIMFKVFISSSTPSFLHTAHENDLHLKYQL